MAVGEDALGDVDKTGVITLETNLPLLSLLLGLRGAPPASSIPSSRLLIIPNAAVFVRCLGFPK